ncbi:MAG: hypothetical protein ACYDA3_14345 [Gaiellaceae bacterium]
MIFVAALAALAMAPATNECRGLQECVPIKGPWVVVPVGHTVPRPQVEFELTCPRGYVVGGVDAELTDRAIDVSYLATSGSPVSPGTTTSRTIVFIGTYVGTGASAPTFRPHAGCVPTSGGGRRTPTAAGAVVPPSATAVRHTRTVRVGAARQITVACAPAEHLVSTNVARAFDTAAPPAASLVARLTASAQVAADRVVVVAHGAPHAIVQVTAICAGGR